MLDTSVTADEMIPLLAFVIVQSNVPRIASLIYYMQYYRLARMIDGSVYRQVDLLQDLFLLQLPKSLTFFFITI